MLRPNFCICSPQAILCCAHASEADSSKWDFNRQFLHLGRGQPN